MAQRFTAWLGKPWSLGQAIGYGTLAVGGLDALAAIVTFGLRGTTPYRIFQGIAVGLLGRASFDGGWATSALGLVLHFTSRSASSRRSWSRAAPCPFSPSGRSSSGRSTASPPSS